MLEDAVLIKVVGMFIRGLS